MPNRDKIKYKICSSLSVVAFVFLIIISYSTRVSAEWWCENTRNGDSITHLLTSAQWSPANLVGEGLCNHVITSCREETLEEGDYATCIFTLIPNSSSYESVCCSYSAISDFVEVGEDLPTGHYVTGYETAQCNPADHELEYLIIDHVQKSEGTLASDPAIMGDYVCSLPSGAFCSQEEEFSCTVRLVPGGSATMTVQPFNVCCNDNTISFHGCDPCDRYIGEEQEECLANQTEEERQEINSCNACVYVDPADPDSAETGLVWTEIGCLDLSPAGLVTRIFQIGLGILGGVGIVRTIQIAQAYQSGDKEKIAEARDMMVSLLAGMMVMIAGIAFLQFVGVNVLGLPAGFLGG